MANGSDDSNSSVPTPGDENYYEYITKTGRYAPDKKKSETAAKKASKKVKQKPKKKGLLEQQMDYYRERNDRMRKIGFDIPKL